MRNNPIEKFDWRSKRYRFPINSKMVENATVSCSRAFDASEAMLDPIRRELQPLSVSTPIRSKCVILGIRREELRGRAKMANAGKERDIGRYAGERCG